MALMSLPNATDQTSSNNVKAAPEKAEQKTPLTEWSSSDKDDLHNLKVSVDMERCTQSPVHLDGGWGWMCVLGCFMMSVLMDGLGRSYGVIYVQIKEKFQGSAAMTLWIGGACSGLRMALGPVSSALTNRFSARTVVLSGGILMGIGCILTGVAPSLPYMFFSYSVVTGFGAALVYTPGVVIVGQYFDRKRGIAQGIGTSGSGVGAFLFPSLLELLFREYGYFGAMLVCGSLMFNHCISGALYRPPEYRCITEITVQRNSDESGVTDSDENSRSSPDMTSSTEASKSETKSTGRLSKLNRYLDLTLLRDPVFLLFASGTAFVIGSAVSGQFLIAALAKHNGLSETTAVLMLSFIGAGDLVARLLSGLTFDCWLLRPYRGHMYTVAGLLSALAWCPVPFCNTFVPLATMSLLHGVFSGTIGGQRAVILSDLLGVQKLASSFGLTMLFQGTATLTLPFVAGRLMDISGNYHMPYFFLVITGSIGSGLFQLIYVFKKLKQGRKRPKMLQ